MEANKERVPSANSSPSNHHQIEEEMQQSDAGPASLPPSAIRKSCCVSQLPPELWSRIFVHLAASLEPPGLLRGPGVVAVDILRAGLTCQALLHASAAGIKALATAVPIYLHIPPLLLLPSSFPNHHQDYHHLPASAPTAVLATPATKAAFEGSPETKPAGEPDWDLIDGVISRPKSCTEAQLRNALRQLRQPSEGSRAEMMSRLRNLLGFAPAAVEPRPRSSPPPARLCVSLQQEREGRCGSAEAEPLSVRLAAALRDMVEAGNGLVGAALAEPSLAAMRRELCALYGNTEGLMEAHRTCLRQLPELRRRRAEERRRSLEVWRRREEEERAKEGVGICVDPKELEHRAIAVHSQLDERAEAFRTCGVAVCVCGRMAARACSLRLCSECCRTYGNNNVPCARHTPCGTGAARAGSSPLIPIGTPKPRNPV